MSAMGSCRKPRNRGSLGAWGLLLLLGIAGVERLREHRVARHAPGIDGDQRSAAQNGLATRIGLPQPDGRVRFGAGPAEGPLSPAAMAPQTAPSPQLDLRSIGPSSAANGFNAGFRRAAVRSRAGGLRRAIAAGGRLAARRGQLGGSTAAVAPGPAATDRLDVTRGRAGSAERPDPRAAFVRLDGAKPAAGADPARRSAAVRLRPDSAMLGVLVDGEGHAGGEIPSLHAAGPSTGNHGGDVGNGHCRCGRAQPDLGYPLCCWATSCTCWICSWVWRSSVRTASRSPRWSR